MLSATKGAIICGNSPQTIGIPVDAKPITKAGVWPMVAHTGPEQIAIASEVAFGTPVSPQPSRVDGSGNDNASPSRDAAELSKILKERDKISIELGQLQGAALSPEELQIKKDRLLSHDAPELARASAERDKLKLELSQLKGGSLGRDELRAKKENEAETRIRELQKLCHEAKNARWSPYFELGKVVVPALAIAVSIYSSAQSIGYQQQKDREAAQYQQQKDREAAQYQRNRDRAVEVSQQLVHFQNQITATIATKETIKPDILKQRNAIAAVRSLGKDAVPSLLANLDLNHHPEIFDALRSAIQELNEDATLREMILRELLSSMKNAASQLNLPRLERYLVLWHAYLRRCQEVDSAMFEQATSKGNQLALDLKQQVQSKKLDQEDMKDLAKAIEQLQSKS
jgi:hypothetical protein